VIGRREQRLHSWYFGTVVFPVHPKLRLKVEQLNEVEGGTRCSGAVMPLAPYFELDEGRTQGLAFMWRDWPN